jgi:hypothetical protein
MDEQENLLKFKAEDLNKIAYYLGKPNGHFEFVARSINEIITNKGANSVSLLQILSNSNNNLATRIFPSDFCI